MQNKSVMQSVPDPLSRVEGLVPRLCTMDYLTTLVSFSCQCREVKFYDFSNRKIEFGEEVSFVPAPDHRVDNNCVRVVIVRGSKRLQLGNVEATAAEWLSPMLQGPFSIKG